MTSKLESLQPVLTCSDMARSIDFYGRSGFTVTFRDDPRDTKYVGIRRDDIELNLQWHARQDFAHGDRPSYRFLVQDVEALYAEFCKCGAIQPQSSAGSPWVKPADTPWNTRGFHVRDPDKNGLQFYRPL
jgi:predicted enzyme related to lactoylglutathione lyase